MLNRVVQEDQQNFIVNTLEDNYEDLPSVVRNFKTKFGIFPVSLKILAGRKVVDNSMSCLDFMSLKPMNN